MSSLNLYGFPQGSLASSYVPNALTVKKDVNECVNEYIYIYMKPPKPLLKWKWLLKMSNTNLINLIHVEHAINTRLEVL